MRFKSNDLKEALNYVKKACATPDVCGPVLQGINFKCENGFCTIAATDLYRVHTRKLLYDVEDNDKNVQFTIPVFDVAKDYGFINIYHDEQNDVCTIKSKEATTTLSIMKGNYLEYEDAFPEEEPEYVIKINPKLLKDALSLKDKSLTLKFYKKYKPVVISSSEKDTHSLVLPMRD